MLNKSEHIGKLLRRDVFADEDDFDGQNIGSVLVSAHCEMTNEEPEDRLQCEQCVLAAIVDILTANITEEVESGLKTLKVCSLEHLSEEHDECIDITDNAAEKILDEMEKLRECGTRIMVRNVVTSCMAVLGKLRQISLNTIFNDNSADGASDQLEMFLQVDNCSQAVAARWMDRGGWGDGFYSNEGGSVKNQEL